MANKKTTKEKPVKTKVYVLEDKLPIYNVPYSVYVGDDMKKVCKQIEKDFPGTDMSPDYNAPVAGYAMTMLNHKTGDRNFILIVLICNDFANRIYTTASHEAIHMAYFMLDLVGITVDPQNHEALTYVHDEIFNKTRNVIDEFILDYSLEVTI